MLIKHQGHQKTNHEQWQGMSKTCQGCWVTPRTWQGGVGQC